MYLVQQLRGVVANIISIIQIRRLRLRKMNYLLETTKIITGGIRNSNPGLYDPKALLILGHENNFPSSSLCWFHLSPSSVNFGSLVKKLSQRPVWQKGPMSLKSCQQSLCDTYTPKPGVSPFQKICHNVRLISSIFGFGYNL